MMMKKMKRQEGFFLFLELENKSIDAKMLMPRRIEN